MLVYPTLEEFKSKAESANLIPVYAEIVADDLTPVGAYEAFSQGSESFLLESVVGGERWGRYSIVGGRSRATVTFKHGRARVDWRGGESDSSRLAEWNAASPLEALGEVMDEWQPADVPGLPRFWGGAVGWLGYETTKYLEDVGASHTSDMPEMKMLLSDVVAIFDNLRQTVKVVSAAYVPRANAAGKVYRKACESVAEYVDKLRSAQSKLAPFELSSSRECPIEWQWSGEEFKDAVAKAKDYIEAGDIFQVVLSRAAKAQLKNADPFRLYRALRVINPSPYMFFLNFDEYQVVGASPETLVRLDEGQISVRPIAGTRRRGDTDREDEALGQELLADAKERAEHLMLVDLGRNDVGRVAKTGTVEVTSFMSIERYSHVMHIVSDVQGQLASGVGWESVVAAALPAGTLSGAPKIRAMQIIEELEPTARGLYGGAVGYVSYGGNLDLAIAIRTAVVRDGEVTIQAGAGIVADSDPEMELQETENKAKGLLAALAVAEQEAKP